jgi:hypothetical protein
LVFHRPHFHALAALGGRVPPSPSVVQQLAERSDGFWYVYIAQHGYGHTLHPLPALTGMHERFSPWAFYPAWPLLIRGFHALAPSSYPLDALILAGLVGFAALCAFYALARGYFDDSTARTATLLLAAWPASGVLNLPYSEGLFIAATAIALLALHRQRWWIAGIAGAVATATRPTGLAVIVAALIAAGLEFRRSKRVLPFIAPLLAACGAGAFVLYGWRETGDPLIWLHSEALWHQRLNLDSTLPAQWARDFSVGGVYAWRAGVQLLGLAFLIAGTLMLLRHRRRLDPVLFGYIVVAMAFIVGYGAVGPRPRFVFVLLPGFVWAARLLQRRTVLALSSLCAALLVPLTLLYLYAVVP